MKTNKNVSHIHDCFGCGVCSTVCSKKLIKIKLNTNGFYEPFINNLDECTNCGACINVCAFNDTTTNDKPIKSWAAWSNDDRIRRKCSSGGIGFEIGKQLIAEGYEVVGCQYNIEKKRAEHYVAKSTTDLIGTMGSKYIQSFTQEAFDAIDKKGTKYLITGTPCQIASIRKLIKRYKCENNFILMDFFCHCVPSMLAWKGYCNYIESRIGNINYVTWRNKFDNGWHDSWIMGIDSTPNKCEPYEERRTEIQSRMSSGDLFYKLFLGDVCIGPQCEKQCRFKYNNSDADIRIGDLWGKTYEDNEKGVSALIAFTDRGHNIIKQLKDVSLVEHPFDLVAEGQMKHNAKHKFVTPLVMFMLRNNYPVNSPLFASTLYLQRIITGIKRRITI